MPPRCPNPPILPVVPQQSRFVMLLQLLRDYIQSIDELARPTPDDLFRELPAYYRERGLEVTREDLCYALDGSIILLLTDVFWHALGILEMEPLEKKMAIILNVQLNTNQPGGMEHQSYDVFTPVAEQPERPEEYYLVCFYWFSWW